MTRLASADRGRIQGETHAAISNQLFPGGISSVTVNHKLVRVVLTVLALVALAGFAAGCGGDDNESGADAG